MYYEKLMTLCASITMKQPMKSKNNWKIHSPKAGAIFSGIGKNHVGIVLKVDGYNITIQDDNYDGITNTFEDAKKDWQTNTYTLDYYRLRMGGIIFANPK